MSQKTNPIEDDDCFPFNTLILMSDGSTKMIQDIQRGDYVAGNSNNTISYRVSRVTIRNYEPDSKIDVCIFDQNSINSTSPSSSLTITPLHVIVDGNYRIFSRKLRNLPGVQMLSMVNIDTVIPIDDLGNFSLWNLQFDTVGFYVANGLTVQSRHPRLATDPLPQELYFDQSLYSDQPGKHDDPAYPIPLIIEY